MGAAALPAFAGGEQELLAALVRLPASEEQALVGTDPDAVESLARAKAACLDRLAALPASRDPSPDVRALRIAAQRANERNGRLIRVRLARVQQRLDALTGRQDSGAAYGADGFARSRGTTHPSQSYLG